MSSPVVFSLTTAQCRALRCLTEGKAGDVPERALRQMVIRGLVSNSAGWALTPAGEAAALMVARLSKASPIPGRPGIGAEDAVSAPGRAPLGLNARSYGAGEGKSQENKGHNRPGLSRLALRLLSAGGYLVESGSNRETVCELSSKDWDLVLAHNAREAVLRQAGRFGEVGVRSLLAELRTSQPAD